MKQILTFVLKFLLGSLFIYALLRTSCSFVSGPEKEVLVRFVGLGMQLVGIFITYYQIRSMARKFDYPGWVSPFIKLLKSVMSSLVKGKQIVSEKIENLGILPCLNGKGYAYQVSKDDDPIDIVNKRNQCIINQFKDDISEMTELLDRFVSSVNDRMDVLVTRQAELATELKLISTSNLNFVEFGLWCIAFGSVLCSVSDKLVVGLGF